MTMKIANIAVVKNQFSRYIALVEGGEEIEICKRNIPVAMIVPIKKRHTNRTRLGSGSGSVKVNADLTSPLIPQSQWDMLGPHIA
jgi:prevent-host-death family protein